MSPDPLSLKKSPTLFVIKYFEKLLGGHKDLDSLFGHTHIKRKK